MKYKSSVNPELQIDTEEKVAAILFDKYGIGEAKASEIAKEITLVVVSEFAPKLVEKTA